MPCLAAVSTIEFEHRVAQHHVRDFAARHFSASFPEIGRMLPVFDNTQIESRNLCEPLEYYARDHTFGEQNREFIRLALDASVRAVGACTRSAGIPESAITDLVFVSTTGLATPSIDAMIIDRMHLNPRVRRMPLFGLGCGGGVSGLAKAFALAKADPQAVVALVAVELCSLTFLRSDFSKSNFVGASLFADGAAACLILGDGHAGAARRRIRYVAAGSRLYYDTLRIMGWDFTDSGFRVLFSPGIPALIAKNVSQDVTDFLNGQGLALGDIKHFIFHPGGRKVLQAYEEALAVGGDFLRTTREVMRHYGNMSSASVLYVLERFLAESVPGYGLMMAMGPGFSSEMVLLDFET